MTEDAIPSTADRRLRALALASAATIGLAHAIAARSNPGPGTTDAPALPPWHALLLMAPYVAIAVLTLGGSTAKSFGRGLATGVAIAMRTGMVALLFLLFAAPILLLAAPSSMLSHGAVVWAIAVPSMLGLLGPGGSILIVCVLFVLQFPLARAARRGEAGEWTDAAALGVMAGVATLLFPVVVGIDVGDRVRAADHRASETARTRAEERDRPVRLAAEAHELTGEARARELLTRLQICAHTGCVDSLVAGARHARVRIDYVRRPRSRYWAMVTSDTTQPGMRYVTDETGIRLRWIPDRWKPVVPQRPDSLQETFVLADSGVARLATTSKCFEHYYLEGPGWGPGFPQHMTNWICALRGDTTLAKLDGAQYRVIYLPAAHAQYNPINSFSLSARPVRYGEPAVRSYLTVERGYVHVTTADRAARLSDPWVHECELSLEGCRLPAP